MTRNTYRFDLSDRLIHFFRALDLSKNDAPETPEQWGFGNITEENNISPFFLLRCAVRQLRLWATWSYRGNKRTIYGPKPAVCFTEMPLAAFIEAGEARAKLGQAMSTYGLMFQKSSLFNCGARPVIYGLSQQDVTLPSGDKGSPRILTHDLLPEHEQYRYVTFNPTGMRKIDWTHEREWRWCYRGELPKQEFEGYYADRNEIAGLDLIGDVFQGMGAIVKTKKQTLQLTYDILTLVDRKDISSTQYSHILWTQNLPNAEVLRDPKATAEAITSSVISLNQYFTMREDQVKQLSNEFSQMARTIEDETPEDEKGEFGECWLWILDNTHRLTRALIKDKRIIVSKDGRYLVRLYEFSDGKSLRQREKMTQILASRLKTRYEIECGYFSVLFHSNPDGVPFYCNDFLDNDCFYNYGNREADY